VSWIVVLVLLAGALIGCASRKSSVASPVQVDNLSEPRNGATSARIDIHAGDGNLIVDGLASENLLAEGTLEYTEKQGLPVRSLETIGGQAFLSLRGAASGLSWSRLPWAACNSATTWQLHLNPTVTTEVIAHSDGGNLRVDLAGTAVTRATADTGGGNVEMVLPGDVAGLEAVATSGAGNVTVRLPRGAAARISVTTGLGKAIVDPSFIKVDDNTYESPEYAGASNRYEIKLETGAGNVIVEIV
jgi:hypothetical protein